MDLSYCVVNTNGRELLLACLVAIREHGPAELEAEVLVVDNASDDGSADAVEAWNAGPEGLGERLRLLRRSEREGKAALDSLVLAEARGELCLLLNEDSELRPGPSARWSTPCVPITAPARPARNSSIPPVARSHAPGVFPAPGRPSRAPRFCTGGS